MATTTMMDGKLQTENRTRRSMELNTSSLPTSLLIFHAETERDDSSSDTEMDKDCTSSNDDSSINKDVFGEEDDDDFYDDDSD
ncbi:hypothetical protein Tco_1374093 [Tanacetum coccineum]